MNSAYLNEDTNTDGLLIEQQGHFPINPYSLRASKELLTYQNDKRTLIKMICKTYHNDK